MARIRYLKPHFFKDEDIAELPFQARLLYQGLWILADREGRLNDRPRWIKAEVFPYDDGIDIEQMLVMLSCQKVYRKRPFIIRYEVGGERFIQILKWTDHQKPHHTEKQSDIPKCNIEEELKKLTVKEPLNVRSLTGRNGNGNGDGEKESPASPGPIKKIDESKQICLKDIELKDQSEGVKHKIFNQIVDAFKARGWRTEPDYVKNVLKAIVARLEDYSPKEFFPYFKKAAYNYINQNAEAFAQDASIARKREKPLGVMIGGVIV